MNRKNNTLRANFPRIYKEWHPTRNSNLNANQITDGSSRKVWWVCGNGHEWEAFVKNRTKHGRGCPYCAGQLATTDNNFAKTFPEKLKEWHPTKNGLLSPCDFTPRSTKLVWWICSVGHEWEASFDTRNKSNCPYCANQRPSSSNNLEVKYPALAKEFNKSRNEGLTPDKVISGSNKPVWWICNNGHEWQASPYSRTSKDTKCPYCTNRLANNENSLAVLFPDIANEWDPNKNGELFPELVIPGSHKSVWWICAKGHKWKTSIKNRTRNGSGCPYCAGQLATSKNNFITHHADKLSFWHNTRNEPLDPSDFLPNSKTQAWWKCDRGHEWKMSFAHRAKFDGCPFCTNGRVSHDNNLLVLYPEIAKEWHPIKNGALNPSDVVHGYSKPVWWICGYGHEWKVSPSSRTLGLTGCPKCSIQTSREELRIYTELRAIFGDVTHRYKIRGIEADIYLPKYGICIEYDGSFYHREKTEIDIKKNEELRSLGLKVIRVREGLDKTQDIDIVTEGVKITKKDIDRLLINLVLDEHDKHLVGNYLREENFRGDEELKYLLSFLPAPPPSNSLEYLYEDVSNEWNYEKNFPLLPSNFKPGSGKIVWWKCKIGHEWSAPIARRTGRQKSGCPYCSNKKVNLENSLKVTHPEIANQWHPTKNLNLLSSQITAGSSKKVWWKCIKGHEWLSPVKSRIHAKGCPFCTGRKICEDNNLAVLNPELAKEWHPAKNFPLKPNDVGKGSHKKVWWICSENHEWLAAIHSRGRGHGCPICSRTLYASRDNRLTNEGTKYPDKSNPEKAFSISEDTIRSGSSQSGLDAESGRRSNL